MILELTVVTVVCLLTFILGAKHFGNLTQTAARDHDQLRAPPPSRCSAP